MPKQSMVTGQKVSAAIVENARAMRRNMTPAEARLWHRLRASRLEGYHFRRQQVIGRFIVDFYCHTACLAVEVDGDSHAGNEMYDAHREQYLVDSGLRVIRFTNQQVQNELDLVLEEILSACRSTPGLTKAGLPGPTEVDTEA